MRLNAILSTCLIVTGTPACSTRLIQEMPDAALPAGWQMSSITAADGSHPVVSDLWGSSDANMYAVAGAIFRSVDFGRTWQSTNLGSTPAVMNAIWGNGPNDLFAVGSCTICVVHSIDGNNWTGTSQTFNSRTDVWASGFGDVYSTGDSQLWHWDEQGSWTEVGVNQDPINRGPTTAIFGVDKNLIFVVGDTGMIFSHSAAGTWARIPAPTTMDLTDVWASPSSAFIAGRKGTLLGSADSGQQWSALESGTSSDLFGVSGTTPKDVYAAGANGLVLHTCDGGLQWSAETLANGITIRALWRPVGAGVLYAGGDSGLVFRKSSADCSM